MFKYKTGKDRAIGFFKEIPAFLGRNMRYAVLGLFVVIFIGCIFVWRSFVQMPDWSEAKKASYVESKNKDISFNQKKFDKAVEEKKRRERAYESDIPDLEDIFRLKR